MEETKAQTLKVLKKRAWVSALIINSPIFIYYIILPLLGLQKASHELTWVPDNSWQMAIYAIAFLGPAVFSLTFLIRNPELKVQKTAWRYLAFFAICTLWFLIGLHAYKDHNYMERKGVQHRL